MGEVVLAHDGRLDRLVAIKRLHAEHAATPDRRERFRREARIAARVNHPAIVQLHDVLHEGDHDYLIMEYIEGRTLRERCAAGPMTVSEVLGIAHQIALGMAAAHDHGVIHRDLKAENILITPEGRAKVTDFGIAKLHGEDTVTADGAVLGTFRAMSPEQAQGRPVDHRSDLFSFGILLYEALTGASPFRADTPYLTVQRLVADDPLPIAELVPSIPADFASLIHQLLVKEPLLRPRNFHEVANALIELAGQTCNETCHASATTSLGSPSSGEDTQSTGGNPAPANPQPAASSTTATASDVRGDRREPTVPPSKASAAPRRRLWYATAVGLAAAGAVVIGYAVRDCGHSGTRFLRVAVLAPRVSGADGRPDVALLATSVRVALMTDVGKRVGLDIVPRIDIDSYVDGFSQKYVRRPEQRAIQAAVGADEVIETLIECIPSSCMITLERDGSGASNPPPRSFSLDADTAGHPDDTISTHLDKLFPDHPVSDTAAPDLIDLRDHERLVQLVHDYWAGNSATATDKVLAELEGIRDRWPRSLDALLFEAEIRRHQYVQTKDPEQARRATALLQHADELSPDTYYILSAKFDIALVAGQLDEAGTILDRLVLLDPDSSVTHLQLAKLHYERGVIKLAPYDAYREFERARGELVAAAQRTSFSWRVLYYRALVSKKLDDEPSATRAAIDQLFERSPGNYAGLSLLAGEELDAGRPACAEQIYAELVAREPLYYECIGLGYALNQLGRYREATNSFHRALAIRPADPSALLDLAESLLLDKDASGAGTLLHTLHEILVDRRRTSALKGNDLLSEAQTLAYLGRDDPALATAARERMAELLTPNASREALRTAALVHAILEDRSQAAKYVTKFLDSGGSPTEFGYPWFDDLRRDPVLGPRLAVPPVAHTCNSPMP